MFIYLCPCRRNSFCGLNIRQNFTPEREGILKLCVYTQRERGRRRRKEQQCSQGKCRDKGKSLSLSACSLPRLENVVAQKNCHNLWLSYEATISQPTNLYARCLYAPSLSIYTYRICGESWRESPQIRFAFSLFMDLINTNWTACRSTLWKTIPKPILFIASIILEIFNLPLSDRRA